MFDCWLPLVGIVLTTTGCAPEAPVDSAAPEIELTPIAPQSTPRPVLQPRRPDLAIWWADHETGDFSQWDLGGTGGVFNTGTGQASISADVAHTGNYSAKLEIEGADHETQAVRLFRWGETQVSRETFVSAWFYFPQNYHPAKWWNVFQFKSKPAKAPDSLSAWSLNVGNRDDGRMYLYLWDAIREKGFEQSIANLPERSWVHIEARYERSSKREGRITVWQDGEELWDLKNVRTAFSEEAYWSVNNYTDDVTPNNPVIFVDDAAISRSRLGPSGLGEEAHQ